MHRPHRRLHAAAAGITCLAVLATACGAPDSDAQESDQGPAPDRLVVASEGKVLVLDGESLDVIEEFPTEEFTRLNAAGDGRNVLVTTSKGFQVLDVAAPELTDLVFEADAAGHVVRHADKTLLFDDGTGDTTIFESDALAAADKLPETEVVPAKKEHHGVSIELSDGTFLTTIGTPDERSGVRVLDTDRKETDSTDECPGVHGEGTAQNEAVVFGCEDGALLYRDGEFTKLKAPDEFGRMGNVWVSESSPLVVGDYNPDPDREGFLLNHVARIDTTEGTFAVTKLPSDVEYTFRDVVRGPEENAYILATDGSVHVLDPATGQISDSYPVIDAWEGPVEWQDPHPAIVRGPGGIAYVTEPANKTVHAIDLSTGEVVATNQIDGVPNEVAVPAD